MTNQCNANVSGVEQKRAMVRDGPQEFYISDVLDKLPVAHRGFD
jgi:hypothetical protein